MAKGPPPPIKVIKIINENTLCSFCSNASGCKAYEECMAEGVGNIPKKKNKTTSVTYRRIITGCTDFDR